MQYRQRRLQRSVTDTRRLRSGRSKRSRITVDLNYPSGRPVRGSSAPYAGIIRRMSTRSLLVSIAAVAALAAAPLAQKSTPKSDGRPSAASAKLETLKQEAVA